jgi:hypothetical protein
MRSGTHALPHSTHTSPGDQQLGGYLGLVGGKAASVRRDSKALSRNSLWRVQNGNASAQNLGGGMVRCKFFNHVQTPERNRGPIFG